jgi:luciferase family oxidoreductase group 1
MIPFSILDLAPIVQGSSAAAAFHNAVDLAQHAERWGYRRFWLAEHHNMGGIASAATALVISHVAAATKSIRVGSGGIMLPNHAPLIIAEQFGTLESLYPGRIDLGLGRAPGTDQLTARALRRNLGSSGDSFPRDVVELQSYFVSPDAIQKVRAVPGAGLNIPIWLLGSSLFSAQLAAMLSLPFAFASHFAPDHLMDALSMYRRKFVPSETMAKPYAMAGMSLIAAETDFEAKRLATSGQQQFLKMRRGEAGPLPPPVATMDGQWSVVEEAQMNHMARYAAVGSPDTVRQRLTDFIAMTKVDEIILTGHVYDHAARLKSFEIASEVRTSLVGAGSVGDHHAG